MEHLLNQSDELLIVTSPITFIKAISILESYAVYATSDTSKRPLPL